MRSARITYQFLDEKSLALDYDHGVEPRHVIIVHDPGAGWIPAQGVVPADQVHLVAGQNVLQVEIHVSWFPYGFRKISVC